MSEPGIVADDRLSRRGLAAFGTAVLLFGAVIDEARAIDASDPDVGGQHLFISEVMTGGASASDELIELYNPGPLALPLEGLEVVYLSATGTAPSRRAAWAAGAAGVPPGHHVLIANEAGTFAPIADAVYAGGIAATGGSVAIRIQGASTAIDAAGWGSAANAWMEGAAAPAPDAGASIERLPGGAVGSTQDTDDNATDFAERSVPDPQNSTSAPTPDPDAPPPTPTVEPSPVMTPAPTLTPGPTAGGTPTPNPPTPAPPGITPMVEARGRPDGATVTVAGVALTDSAFTDGGGYLTDGTAGIAVLLSDGAFGRGDAMTLTGELDDRFAQRTIRANGAGFAITGTGAEPQPVEARTGAIGEALEGRLVRINGAIEGAATSLSGGLAFDIDDGSGVTRLVVATATGIDVSAWSDGIRLEVVGVVGQRDSSGTGTTGYRVQPRAPGDILSAVAATPAPSTSSPPSPGSSGSPGASPEAFPLVSVARARALPTTSRVRLRGVVTLGTGVVDDVTAGIQDASGAILLRLSDTAGALARGTLVEAAGVRSTKSGMLTVRVTQPPLRLGAAAQPAAVSLPTGSVGEADEAKLVVVRGSLAANPRTARTGTVTFNLDDGSGPLQVTLYPAAAPGRDILSAGGWVEVTGVVGQVTSGSEPTRGYRLWPRAGHDVRLLAAPVAATDQVHADGVETDDGRTAQRDPAASVGELSRLVSAAAGGPIMEVRATLVAGAWPQLGLAGVLWDGERAVGIAEDGAGGASVTVAAASGLPVAVSVRARPPVSLHGELGLPIIDLASRGLERSAGAANHPAATPPSSGPPTWVSVNGLLRRTADGTQLTTAAGGAQRLDVRCQPSPLPADSRAVVVLGLGVADPPRVVIGCGGVHAAASLTAASLSDAHPPSPSVTGSGSASASAKAGDLPHTVPAALLMAAAFIGLATAGKAAWRRRLFAQLARGQAAGPDGAVPSGRGAVAEEEPARALTLRQLPRERGSP